jgi:hypothetical protein
MTATRPRDGGPGWHEHYPGETIYSCEACAAEDRLELEQGEPLPEWARGGRGLLVHPGDGEPTLVVTAPLARYPDYRPADHELEPAACKATKATHVHYARTIAWPAGYWPEEPTAEQRA